MTSNIWIDNNWYIINNIHIKNIEEPWLALLKESINEIKIIFKNQLDSIYIYWSVGRWNAKLHSSDLDLTVILNVKITQKIKNIFEKLNIKLSKKYPFTRDVGFDIGTLDEVVDKKNFYSWGAWIKCNCFCVYWNDLFKNIPMFKPSNDIANGINWDLDKWIESYILKVKKAKNKSMTKLYCQQIMKKIIRTWFSLVMVEENSWTWDLKISYDLFSKHYPSRKNIMKEVLDFIDNPIDDKKYLIDFFKKFDWFIEEINTKIKYNKKQ